MKNVILYILYNYDIEWFRIHYQPQNRGWFKQSQWQPMSSDGWGRFTATGFSIYVPYQSISNIEVLPIEKFVQDPLHVRPCIAHSPRQPINCGFKTGPPNVAPETRQVPRTIGDPIWGFP